MDAMGRVQGGAPAIIAHGKNNSTCRGDVTPVTYLFSAIYRGYVPLLSLILGPAIRA